MFTAKTKRVGQFAFILADLSPDSLHLPPLHPCHPFLVDHLRWGKGVCPCPI